MPLPDTDSLRQAYRHAGQDNPVSAAAGISVQLHEATERLGELHRLMEEMEGRFAPMLTPQPPREIERGGTVGTAKDGPISDVQGEVRALNRSLGMLRDRITALIGRCEL